MKRVFDRVVGVAGPIALGVTVVMATYNFATSTPIVTKRFHEIYHTQWWDRTVDNTHWFGVPAQKCPLDMWVFQEIIWETRPDVILEMGTRKGGTALYFAHLLDLLGHGRVISVDIQNWQGKPEHPRITYLIGSSTSREIERVIKESIRPGEKVLLDLDSDHTKEHVLQELELYSRLVPVGGYVIVEDTHLTGHPVDVSFTPGPGKEGPWEAVQEFLAKHPEFEPDRSREKYGLTFNPRGWLKRTR